MSVSVDTRGLQEVWHHIWNGWRKHDVRFSCSVLGLTWTILFEWVSFCIKMFYLPFLGEVAIILLSLWSICVFPQQWVPMRSPSHGWDVVVYVKDIHQSSLPTFFYSVLLSISVFMAHSTVFHSINFPDNLPLSYSVLPVSVLLYWCFQLYISLWKFPSAVI